MRSAKLGPLQLELCFPCSGIWFDHGELPLLVRAGPEAVARLAERFPRGTGVIGEPRQRCPICRLPLEECEFPSMPGIRLAGCGYCQGFWLTVAQLQEIATRLRAAHANATATRDIPPPTPVGPAPPIVPRRPGPAVTPATPLHEQIRCPACSEANEPAAPVCWACGAFLRPAGTGNCPSCAALLRREVSDGVDLGFCPDCGGTWLEDGRLTDLRAQPGFLQDQLVGRLKSRGQVGVGALEQRFSCPKCRLALQPEDLGVLSAVPIFTCPKCFGSFLECGRLADFLGVRLKR
jgi:Zn-finger nucleic acid-binding protein